MKNRKILSEEVSQVIILFGAIFIIGIIAFVVIPIIDYILHAFQTFFTVLSISIIVLVLSKFSVEWYIHMKSKKRKVIIKSKVKKIKISNPTSRRVPKPGKFALFFAAALQKPEDREYLIDNIEERFAKDVKKHGLFGAKALLWLDNLVSFYSAIGAKIIKGLRWAGLGYLIEKFLIK